MGHLWKLIKEGITTNKIVDRRDIHWEKWKYIFIININKVYIYLLYYLNNIYIIYMYKPDLFIHVVDLF